MEAPGAGYESSGRGKSATGISNQPPGKPAATDHLLGENLMDECYRDRPLADRRGDALDVAAADVADGEDAGQAGFEQVRRAGQRPVRRRQILRASGPARS